VKILQNWGTKFENPGEADWYRPDLWRNMGIFDWIVSLGFIPLAVYLLAFVPIFGAAPIELVRLQKEIWDSQWRVTAPHEYMSSWINWALMRRPVLYLFDRNPENPSSLDAIIFLGNPAVLWGGNIALVACIYGWIKNRRRDAFIISISWITFYFIWALVNRPVSFYYYYFPAGMVMSFALTYLFYQTRMVRVAGLRYFFLCLVFGVFIYFYPVSSAITGVTDVGFTQRMWFETWPKGPVNPGK